MKDLDAALLRCHENIEEFQSTMSDLRQETLALNARLRAFDRKITEVGREIKILGEQSRELSGTMDRVARLTA